jgi:exodeoxyribonuclease VII small subunit
MSEDLAPDRPFEESLGELERIVRDLEDGQLGLDEALARYEQGIALLKQCHGKLQQAEQRILVLTGLEGDGQPVLQPFKHEATARPTAGLARARKRASDGE